MVFQTSAAQFDELLKNIQQKYDIYAPKRFAGGGHFSDTDCIRYDKVKSISEVVFDVKSEYSFKEVLTPVSQTLFYYTENETKEADGPAKGAVIFMRSCDVNALKRLDDIYLRNGTEDYYYSRIRKNIKVVLMGCEHSFENCFCVSMGTNEADEYDMRVDRYNGDFMLECRVDEWAELLAETDCKETEYKADVIISNSVDVKIPEDLDDSVINSTMWDQYDKRCISCGRCNFVCPTCSCFTMQDIFYTDNGKVGERRRVMASCMVDGFTDVAGGGCPRPKNSQRMRFKVLHKVLDFRQRNGYNMCVGCGRCDDICPEYISFSHCVNNLEDAMKEVNS